MNNLKQITLLFALLIGTSSCIDMSTLKGDLKVQVDQTTLKTTELQKAVNELNNQVKTLNEENNSVKSLVSKVSDHVIAQQTKIEELELQIKTLQTQPKSMSGSKKKH